MPKKVKTPPRETPRSQAVMMGRDPLQPRADAAVGKRISRQETRVYAAMLAQHGAWLSAAELAERSGVPVYTARGHLARMVTHGVLDIAELFPAFRYRLSADSAKRNPEYVSRIEAAIDVFGTGGAS